MAHGTAVVGTVLYGALNSFDAASVLPEPPVSAVSIRVLPLSNPADRDLYEIIDCIENAVPIRQDIQIYCLSLGPRGPILEDQISRFTYVLDTLAVAYKVVFYVAVGNDGRAGPDLNRIQSPSDLVNGVGVGAYTIFNGQFLHAPYACIGQGREGGKVKPDVSGYGGCERHPIHLVSATPGVKLLNMGTSFATPIVARLGALASQSFERGTPLLGRGLVIHTAKHPNGEPDVLLGHGIVDEDIRLYRR